MLYWTAITTTLKGLKAYWLYIGIAVIIIALGGYHYYKVSTLGNEILKRDIIISENNTTISVLTLDKANCRAALDSASNSVDMLSDEIKKANERYKEFELDRNKTARASALAIKTLQNKVIELQDEAIVLKKASYKKSDAEILTDIKKDMNKTIDSVRAIEILFGEKK